MYRKDHPVEFFTATNLNWLPLLENKFHKEILIEALKHRVDNKQLTIYAFVIMPNHFHIIWQVSDGVNRNDFQRDLMKFTSRSILNFMRMNNDTLVNKLKVDGADRNYQLWERNSLGIELFTEDAFIQKLNYLHNNPIQSKWNLSISPEDYYYSSARFYEMNSKDDFGLLTHFRG
jgi:putative transposase